MSASRAGASARSSSYGSQRLATMPPVSGTRTAAEREKYAGGQISASWSSACPARCPICPSRCPAAAAPHRAAPLGLRVGGRKSSAVSGRQNGRGSSRNLRGEGQAGGT
jgi:hypothetical protein